MPLVLVLLSVLAVAAQTPLDDEALARQARTAFQQGDFAQARQAAERMLQRNPRSGDAEVLLGLLDTVSADLDGAERRFTRAVSLQPGNPRAWGYLGSTHLRQSRLREAERAFAQVLRLDPGNSAAHYNLGTIALLQRDAAAALPHFRTVHEADPSDVPALLGMLESQLQLKQPAEVERSVTKLVRLPVQAPQLAQVGALLTAHGQHATAVPLLARLRASSPQSFDANYNLSLALLRSGKYDEAAGALQPFLASPRKAEAYNLLGAVEEKRGRYKEAKEAHAQAATLDHSNEDFRVDYAGVLIHEQTMDAALRAFQEGVQDFPRSVRLRLGLGSVYYLAGQYTEAAQTLLETVQIEPKTPAAYDLLGKAVESVPALQEEIMRAFEGYLQHQPRDPVAYCHYGTMLAAAAHRQGQTDFRSARRCLQLALAQAPTLAQAHLQLGTIAEAEGNLPEAIRSFERAVHSDPQLAAARYRLGTAYRRLGDAAKAETELALFQKLKSAERAQEVGAVRRTLAGAPH